MPFNVPDFLISDFLKVNIFHTDVTYMYVNSYFFIHCFHIHVLKYIYSHKQYNHYSIVTVCKPISTFFQFAYVLDGINIFVIVFRKCT